MSLNFSNVPTREERIISSQAAQIEQLQAQLASQQSVPLTRSPSSSSHNGRIQKHRHHRHGIPRSHSSSSVIPTARHLSLDQMEVQQSRARAFSQRSAPLMARGTSQGSNSQRSGNLPFTQNGPMPPPLQAEPRRENPAMTAWIQPDEQPLSSYTLSHQQFQSQRLMHRAPGLEQVRELEDLIDPSDYIRNIGTPFAVSPSNISIPSPSTMSIHRHSSSFSNQSTTPLSDMITNATTLTSSMSRQDSLCNEPFLEQVSMMRCSSNSSYSPPVSFDHTLYDQTNQFPSLHNRRSLNDEQSKLLVGAGASLPESQIPRSFPLQSSSYGTKMEKSESIESNTSSSSSSSSRNVKRLQDQIRSADARPLLMPKGGSVVNSMSRENSSQSMTRIESRDSSQDKKVAISSKSTYQRPKHDRVQCDQCDSHPEGFRGQHELSRHKDREHKKMVKKWVCIEATNPSHQEKPVVPLSRCKACSQQKKKYGAYYNAAAHLRRAHFRPKPKGRGKSSKVDDVEKRGGKGGGDWPPMSELKHWMAEVEEPASEFCEETPSSLGDGAEDETVEDLIDSSPYSQQPLPSMIGNSFDNSYTNDTNMLNIDTSMLNNYANPINDIYSMGTMASDLSIAQSCDMEQTLFHTPGVPNTFPNFSHDIYASEQQMLFDNCAFLSTPLTDEQIFAGSGFANHQFY